MTTEKQLNDAIAEIENFKKMLSDLPIGKSLDTVLAYVCEMRDVLCVRCGFNVEFVDFEGEGKRAICRKCEKRLDSLLASDIFDRDKL